jgi:hypothetical protein
MIDAAGGLRRAFTAVAITRVRTRRCRGLSPRNTARAMGMEQVVIEKNVDKLVER